MVEVVPAILVKSREDLLDRIARTRNFAKMMHIDIMDNIFVPNKTIGTEELSNLPNGVRYEFHWMVKEPERYIEKVKGPHLHLVHVETISDFGAVRKAVKKAGGVLGLALNPETPVEEILPFARYAKRILVMAVHPGFSGQGYIKEVEGKIAELRKKFSDVDIEVDGGINAETAEGAATAGANILAAANSIFSKPHAGNAIKEIKKSAEGNHG